MSFFTFERRLKNAGAFLFFNFLGGGKNVEPVGQFLANFVKFWPTGATFFSRARDFLSFGALKLAKQSLFLSKCAGDMPPLKISAAD